MRHGWERNRRINARSVQGVRFGLGIRPVQLAHLKFPEDLRKKKKEKMADVRFSGVSGCQDHKAQLLLSWHSLLHF